MVSQSLDGASNVTDNFKVFNSLILKECPRAFMYGAARTDFSASGKEYRCVSLSYKCNLQELYFFLLRYRQQGHQRKLCFSYQ